MNAIKFELTVNGERRTVNADPRQTLLEVLREELGLTGTKYGCGEGECAACTVLVEGEGTRAAHSCQMKMAEAAGKSVITIEGLAKGETLHPVQAAFLEAGAFQCGYCTAGMILGTVALLAEHPHPTDEQIKAGLNGHICRCCGYARFMQAVHHAAEGKKA